MAGAEAVAVAEAVGTAVAMTAADTEAVAAAVAEAKVEAPERPPLSKGQRIRVYWTEEDEWYDATHLSTRKAVDNDGEHMFESHIEYDPVGVWLKQTRYWHCLQNELWEPI